MIAFFVKSQGISETEVNDWKEQINNAEKEGRFGFYKFPSFNRSSFELNHTTFFFGNKYPRDC